VYNFYNRDKGKEKIVYNFTPGNQNINATLLKTESLPDQTQQTSDKSYKFLSQNLSYLRTNVPDPIRKTPDLSLFYPEISVNDLENVRNRYAMRLQKGLAEYIIKHPNARDFYLYLELKPLFRSGVIFNESGRIPYKKIALFIGEGESTIRKKLSNLKRLGLISIDKKKNISLATLNKLPEILKISPSYILTEKSKRIRKFLEYKKIYKQKYKLLNNGETQYTIKQIAIYENLNRQKYALGRKILERELLNYFYSGDPLDNLKTNGSKPKNFTECERLFPRKFIKRFKKQIRENFPEYQAKYKRIYDSQILQREFKFPDLNPNITLAYSGIAKVLNRKAKSTGSYQVSKLLERKYISAFREYEKIPARSPAVWESITGMRRDIFSYKYNARRSDPVSYSGRIEKFFRRCPNSIETLTNSTFYE
jgi:hypothetical protein